MQGILPHINELKGYVIIYSRKKMKNHSSIIKLIKVDNQEDSLYIKVDLRKFSKLPKGDSKAISIDLYIGMNRKAYDWDTKLRGDQSG